MRAARTLGWLLVAALCGVASPAVAQQTGKVARVGWVTFDPDAKALPRASALEGFRTGLREHGWIEGKNLQLELRAGDRIHASEIARSFVGGKVDVIFSDGAMINGLRSVTGTTPIVFTMSGDPTEAKWVASYSRPGGSITGLTSLHLELEGKRLGLLKEIIPGLRRVAVLAQELHPGFRGQLQTAQTAARQLGLTLVEAPIRAAGDLERAFDTITKGDVQAIMVFSDSLVNHAPVARAIAEFAKRRRIPTVSSWPSFVEQGNLLSYGPHEKEFFHRAASYVDRILRGANPGDLPVELPARFELTINQGVAKSIGIVIPQSVMVRADRVID